MAIGTPSHNVRSQRQAAARRAAPHGLLALPLQCGIPGCHVPNLYNMPAPVGILVFGFTAGQIVRDAGVDDPAIFLEMIPVGVPWHRRHPHQWLIMPPHLQQCANLSQCWILTRSSKVFPTKKRVCPCILGAHGLSRPESVASHQFSRCRSPPDIIFACLSWQGSSLPTHRPVIGNHWRTAPPQSSGANPIHHQGQGGDGMVSKRTRSLSSDSPEQMWASPRASRDSGPCPGVARLSRTLRHPLPAGARARAPTGRLSTGHCGLSDPDPVDPVPCESAHGMILPTRSAVCPRSRQTVPGPRWHGHCVRMRTGTRRRASPARQQPWTCPCRHRVLRDSASPELTVSC